MSNELRVDGLTGSGNITINGSMTGKLNINGNLPAGTAVTVNGDATKEVIVNGVLGGLVRITGTVPDGATNYVQINKMVGGTFRCGSLGLLRPTTGRGWLEIGDFSQLSRADRAVVGHTGTVKIDGELSGRVYVLGSSRLRIEVGTINAPAVETVVVGTTSVNWGKGGVTFADEPLPATYDGAGAETAEPSRVIVENFVNGEIRFAPVTWSATDAPFFPFGGEIKIRDTFGANAKIDNETSADVSLAIRPLDFFADVVVGPSGEVPPPPALGEMNGSIRSTRDLFGKIQILGSLLNGVSGAEVSVSNAIGTTTYGGRTYRGYVCVDYDGWHALDDWATGAAVAVGTATPYTGNAPATGRIWEVQECHGDMNNDGTLNNFDIDPFVLALNDAGGYAAAFPGLEGSRTYHGDCNCDGAFNNFDIDPFITKLLGFCCECVGMCPPLDDGGGDEGGFAAQGMFGLGVEVETLGARDAVARPLAVRWRPRAPNRPSFNMGDRRWRSVCCRSVVRIDSALSVKCPIVRL